MTRDQTNSPAPPGTVIQRRGKHRRELDQTNSICAKLL